VAIQQQKRITQQLEDIRLQQRSREARLRIIGPLLVSSCYIDPGRYTAIAARCSYLPTRPDGKDADMVK